MKASRISAAMIEALHLAARGPITTSARPIADRATVNPRIALSLQARGWLARRLDADGAIIFRATAEGRALHQAAACAFCAEISGRGYTSAPCDSRLNDGRPLPSSPKRQMPPARGARVLGVLRRSRPYAAASVPGSADRTLSVSGDAREQATWSTKSSKKR